MSRSQRWGLLTAAAAAAVLLWPAIRALAGQLAAAYVLMGLALPLCARLERRLLQLLRRRMHGTREHELPDGQRLRRRHTGVPACDGVLADGGAR